MSLSSAERNELVRLRLENAEKAIEDAKMLFDNSSLRGAMNRTYYSMFYTVSALAVADGKSFSKHTNLIDYFQEEYAKPEIIDRKYGRALQKAFEDRSEADYQDYLHTTEEQISVRLQEAREFLSIVRQKLLQRSSRPA